LLHKNNGIPDSSGVGYERWDARSRLLSVKVSKTFRAFLPPMGCAAMAKPLCFLLLFIAVLSAMARERAANWIEVRSPSFTIITNTGEKQGRRITLQFERMRALFQQAYPQMEDDSDAPIFVLAVKNKNQFRALQPSTHFVKKALPRHGMFVRTAEKNYILMRLDTEAGNPFPVVYHEYTHLFLGQASQRVPLWLNEGLAEFYQQTEIYDRDVLLGEPNEQHLMLLKDQKLVPLSTLFTVDENSPYYLEEKKGSLFYAECWALTHYLMLKDYGAKTATVARYMTLVNQHLDPVNAAVQVFGDLRQLQKNLELYIDQGRFGHFETKISSNINTSGFEGRSITPAQADAVKADYLAASGRTEEARALLPSAPKEDAHPEISADGTAVDSGTAESKLRDEIGGNVSCPLSQILEGASERAIEMVDNLQRFTANEEIEHTEFRRNGRPRKSTNQLFSYVAEIDQASSGAFWIEEYRLAKSDGESPPLSDTGTAAFALIFHPQKVRNFEFHCEGRAELHGIPAWQLSFEESTDPRKSFHQIRIERSVYQLRFKGEAWIAADNFEILRLQTDLVAPIPQIRLQLEHLDISYAPVDFDKPKLRVWLPESASMQISYHGHSYQRVHKFSHFQLFLVVTQQTVKEPGPGSEE
jgi:hypothetical protein